MSEPRIYRLLLELRRQGGSLVRAQDCPIDELAQAKARDRYTFDADGFAFVYRPPQTPPK